MAKTLETSVEISGVLSPSLQSAIKNAVSKLEEMSSGTLKAAGAAEKLAAEITTQESVLKALERGYADFVVSGDEGSEEAQELAQNIQDLSSELDENKETLSAAEAAAQKLADGMDDTGDEAEGLDDSLEKADEAARLADEGFTVFKATLANLAADAIRSAIQGLKNLAGNVLDLGMGFTGTMSEVQAISGATGDELELLESTAREYGATTVFSASESAEALKYMALAGWDVEQSTSALGGVLNLAAASGMELGAASDMVTDYLSAFGMEADQAAYFADMLAAAQSSSNTTAEALGEAYANCAANLNAAGQDVETVTSLLEGMANQGYKGSRAGTSLAAIMRDITNAMDGGAIKIGDTSVAVQDAQGNFRDLTDILTDVEKATDGMGDAEKAAALSTTFTADSTKGLNLLLNEGMDSIAGYEENLRGASGTAEEMAAIMNDNLGGDIAQMNSAWEELGLKIYDSLEGVLRSAVQFVTSSVIPAIEWLLGHLPEVGIVLSSIAAVVAKMKWTAISKKLTMVKGALKGVAGALGGISAPVLAVIAVVAALVAAFVNLWRNNEDFRNKITAIWDGIKNKFAEFGQGIVDRLNALGFDFESITEVLGAVWEGFCNLLAPVFEGAFQVVSTVLGTVLDVLTGLFDVFAALFTGDWSGAWEAVKGIFSGIWDGIVSIFGTVTGTLTGLADAFLGLFGTNWETVWGGISSFFSGIWEGISSFFSGIWNGIVSFFTGKNSEASESTTSTWGGISSFLSGILGGIQSVFETVWGAISGVVSTVMGAISGVVNTIMSLISGDWSGAWEGIKSTASTVWSGITSVVSTAASGLGSLLSGAWEGIKSVAGTAWEGVKSAVSTAWDGVTSAVTTVADNIGPALSTAWEGIKSTASTAWEGVKSAITTVADTIGPALSTTWDTISSAASTAWEGIKSTASTAWEGISSAASSAWDGISSFFSGIWDGITGKTESSTSQVATTSSTAWNGVATDAETALAGVDTAVTGAWEGIESSVSSEIASVQSTMDTGWAAIGSGAEAAWASTSTAVTTASSQMESAVSAACAAIETTGTTTWTAFKTAATTNMTAAQTAAKSGLTAIGSAITSEMSKALSTASSTFSSILSTVQSKMQAAASAVQSAVSTMRAAMNFSWSLPHLKVPHVSVSGTFSIEPPSAPRFSVSWYKEGGILTQPTIFGASGNTLLAGGEAGAEAVLPLAYLWEHLEDAIKTAFDRETASSMSGDEGVISKAGELLQMDDFSLGELSGAGGVTVIYDFSGFTWSPTLQSGGSKTDDDDLMAKLRAHEAEFFDWLEEFVEMREVAQYA